MPAIIPQYEQRTRASGGGQGEPVRSPQAESAGLFAVGQAVGQLIDARERVKEEDAATWATENLAKAQGDWNAELLKRKEDAADGAPDFTATVLKDYDEASRKLVEQAPTKRSRAFIEQRLIANRVAIQNDAMVFEATAWVSHTVKVVDDATDRKRQVVQVSPERFDDMLREQEVLIDALRLPAARKELLKQQAHDSLARDAVTGLINRNPYTTLKALNQEPGKSGVSSIEALNADDRLQLRNAAQAEINRREVEQRARMVEAKNSLIESRNDALAAKAAGLPAQLPARSLYEAVFPKDGAKRYAQDTQLLSTYDAANAAVLLPPDEGMAKILAFKPTQQEGAAAQAEVQQHAMQLYAAQRKAFEEDPAGTLIVRDPDMKSLFQKAAEGDEAAAADYISKVRSAQEASGIAKVKILPAGAADSLAAALAFNPEKPGQRAANLDQLSQQWGRYFPQIVREISPKLEGDARVMIDLRPEVAKQYDQALATADKIKSVVPSDVQRDVKQRVVNELEGLAETLIYADDGQARLAEIQEATQLLAMSYTKNGTSAQEAAEKAAHDVVNERYNYRDTMRIPVAVSADAAQAGAQAIIGNLDASTLAVQPMAREEIAGAQADLKSHIVREGYWVTVDGDSAAELRVPYLGGSVPVTRTDGSRVRYTWKELSEQPAIKRITELTRAADRQAGGV